MRTLFSFFSIIFLSVAGARAEGAHTQARLALSADTAKPGDTVMAGIVLQMDARWHTYWRNPGEAGIATKVDWQLPQGVEAGEIQWPVPEKGSYGGLVTYQYEHEAVLFVPLRISADLKPGAIDLAAKISWLECETEGLCVPGRQNVNVRLNIGGVTKPSADAELIETWKKKLPQSGTSLAATASWEKPAEGDSRPLVVEWNASVKPESADFFPRENTNYDIAPLTDLLAAADGKVRLRKSVTKSGDNWPASVAGLLVQKAGASEQAYEVDLQISTSGSPASTAATSVSKSFWKMLAFAFIGGLVLNIMPCVFPVIALKIFGFVQQSKEEPKHVFALGLIYGLGVIASFLVMAGMVIFVKQAGGNASWGMQLQSAQFSAALTVLVTLVALNLFGVFEVNLGGRAMSTAGQLASKHGAAGAFFNGILATLLATPCTAPFLAPALGFAFVQPPLVILLFFIAIGIGLASPYLVLSWKPGWLKFLPRPGAWMEKFKVAMGFPMLATAMWLFWFTAPRFGEDGVLWLGLFLVAVALAAWIWGEFVQRGSKRRGLAMAICLILFAVSYVGALESKLHWRSPSRQVETFWKIWSPEAVQKAHAEGRPILVDFTAKWCVTCNTIVKPAVDNPDVRQKLSEIKGVALLADNTDFPPAIIAELKKFGSAGVPLVLVYPRDASKPPVILPTLLTKGIVLAELTKAAM